MVVHLFLFLTFICFVFVVCLEYCCCETLVLSLIGIDHPGNKILGSLIDMSMDRYMQANVGEKLKIREEIMGTIQHAGGRFLSRSEDDGEWMDVTGDVEAMERIIRGFRNSKFRREGGSAM